MGKYAARSHALLPSGCFERYFVKGIVIVGVKE